MRGTDVTKSIFEDPATQIRGLFINPPGTSALTNLILSANYIHYKVERISEKQLTPERKSGRAVCFLHAFFVPQTHFGIDLATILAGYSGTGD